MRRPGTTRLSSCIHLRSDHFIIVDDIPLAVDCTQTAAGDPSNSVSFVIHSLLTSFIVKSDLALWQFSPSTRYLRRTGCRQRNVPSARRTLDAGSGPLRARPANQRSSTGPLYLQDDSNLSVGCSTIPSGASCTSQGKRQPYASAGSCSAASNSSASLRLSGSSLRAMIRCSVEMARVSPSLAIFIAISSRLSW